MSQPYQETLSGAPLVRSSPGPRHEMICAPPAPVRPRQRRQSFQHSPPSAAYPNPARARHHRLPRPVTRDRRHKQALARR